MTCVYPKPNESIDELLKRFKKTVERAGILAQLKEREYFEKPSVKNRRKQIAARKRALKRERLFKSKRSMNGNTQNFKWNHDKTKKIPLPPTRKPEQRK